MEDAYYEAAKQEADHAYHAQVSIRSPFFKEDVALGFEGFRHLQYSARGERSKEEQVARFTLLPKALQVLKTATTLQGYRVRLVAANGPAASAAANCRRSASSGDSWPCLLTRASKTRIVVRKLGDGKLHFWSVMRYSQEKMQRRFTG